MTRERELELIELLNKEVKPALGCTEPVAVALAVARACEALRAAGANVENVNVEVSANILKNAMGVGIPGTGMVGLNIAVALAVTCGKSEYKLEVLKDLSDKAIEDAKQFVDQKRVKVSLADTPVKLYIKAYALGGGHEAYAVVKDNHDSIVEVVADGKSLLDAAGSRKGGADAAAEKTTLDYHLTLKEIYEFATTAKFEDIRFILKARDLNKALAKEGLKGDYGLKVGKSIAASTHNNFYGNSIVRCAMASTAAASDARMAGCTMPAMSNSGSGNQGITVTMPVVAVADELGADEETLCRALIMSHLTAIHIKGYLGKLSALCGCVIASTGSSCGIVYLYGGKYEQMCAAVMNMAANLAGMCCDGAKIGCALKVATGVGAAVQSAMLALDGISVSSNDGIVDDNVEYTIRNLGQLGSKGMQETDKMILQIMVNKK